MTKRGPNEQWAIDHGVTVIQQDGTCFDGVDLNELIEYMRERDIQEQPLSRCCDYATDSSGTIRFHLKDCPDSVMKELEITEEARAYWQAFKSTIRRDSR